MVKLQQTLDRLTMLPKFESGKPASNDDIVRIEEELRVVLPKQYLEFLKRFGSARWFGERILGTHPLPRLNGEPTTLTSDCIKVTKEERQPNNPLGTAHLPPAHVVVATDGGGGNYVLFAAGSLYEGEVHYYNFEDQAEPIQTWKTFNDFLEYRLEETIGT